MTTRVTIVDETLSNYDLLGSDEDWERLKQASTGTDIEEAVGDLGRAWEGLDHAHSLPHVFATEVPVSMSSVLGVPPSELPDLWRELLSQDGFRIGLAASAAQGFTGHYFAYEHFLARVIETRSGAFPRTTADLEKSLEQQLPSVFAQCWNDHRIQAARHARDAIVHRGGRVQTEDKGKGSRRATHHFQDVLHVEHGRIWIKARHTRELYQLLLQGVLDVIAAHKATPAGSTLP